MISVNKEIFPKDLIFKKNYRLKEMLTNEFNNIENNIKVLSVVGTNGKGSTTLMLSEGMKTQYKKVGMFISPAFLFHNERVQINNEYITDEEIKNILDEYNSIIRKYELTYFEIWTFIGIIHFTNNNVEVAIIEAGIGGKFDSTNVFENQLAVIVTSISIDHINILGNKIEDIIDQKIGIWKGKSKIFVANSNKKYKKYFDQKNIEFIFADESNSNNIFDRDNRGLVECVFNNFNLKVDLSINKLLGRMTILKSKPLLLIDGAHNIDALEKLAITISDVEKPLILIGLSDLSKVQMCKNIFKDNEYLFVNFESEKSVDLSNQKNFTNDWKKTVRDNLHRNIIATGSLYFLPLIVEEFGNGDT
ncbi:folylpolyglutamate synthase [Spiroplasma sp. TIUS-1]|uniref:Mur ligase family protein n=1 Tax=Spiroplasma sp. TIUS-1 TaxID=216963 RepID=UPI0013985683|nr:Mur ligase family protein [Spiroplasma sp. TIUS-1]QHX36189.1 folylpolyglutamate synthase [Spiroplasma sp. TIUS-1]